MKPFNLYKRSFLGGFLAFLFFTNVSLNVIIGQSLRTKEQVQKVSQTFLSQEQATPLKPGINDGRKSAETTTIASGLMLSEIKQLEDDDGDTIAYIQELKPQGFIIISANTNITPVLGFSFTETLSFDEISSNPLFDLLVSDIKAREKLRKATTLQSDKIGIAEVWGPWVETTWHQDIPWNNKCPYEVRNNPGPRRPVGCVATAMSQIINYWKYPKSVNFSILDYIYISNVAKYLTDTDAWGIPTFSDLQNGVSELLYNGNPEEEAFLSFASGVKLHMNYKSDINMLTGLPYYTSGANTYSVRDKLNKQFDFGSAVAYSDWAGVWYEHSSGIIEDMKIGWPAQIGIHKSRKTGGHSIVVDGWRDDGFFHLNYGWGANSPDPISTAWYNIPTDMPDYDVVHTVVYRIEKYLGWNQFGANQRNSFNAIYPAPSNLPQRKWLVNIPGELANIGTSYSFSHLIIGTGGRIYASLSPSDLGSVYHPFIAIYDKFGTLENLIEVTHSNVKIPYLSQNSRGQVFFSSGTGGPTATDSRIFRLNPKTDEITPIFSHNSPDPGIVERPIKIDRDDNLYFVVEPRYAANYTKFYSTTRNGTMRWSHSFPASAVFYTSIPAIDEERNLVYLNYFLKTEGSSGLSHLIAFNLGDGTVVFDKQLPTSTHLASKSASAPSISENGTIYVDADDILFAIQPTTGIIVWQRTFSWRGANPIASIGSNGEIYVTYNDKVMSLNPGNGATIWEKSYTLGSSEYIGEIYSTKNKMVIISFEKDGIYQLDGIKDNGSTYESRYNLEGGGRLAFGPGSSLVSIPPGHENSIWTLSDQGERGDTEGLGMDYADNHQPIESSNPFPENGSTNQDTLSVTLSWSGGDPDGHSLKYDVYIYASIEGEEASFSPVATQITGNSCNLTNLLSGAKYSWTVVASDGQAVAEGPVWSFTTKESLSVPILSTTNAFNIAMMSAISGGDITDDRGSTVTARGVCWSTSSNPTADLITKTSDGTGLGTFTSAITGLSPGTTYFLRAYATNSFGTSYGDEISFKTYNSNAIQDIEGNYYNIMTIGSQAWMAENLKTTKYNDGTSIPLITEHAKWNALSTPAYCWYNNDISNKTTYGALYNRYVANTEKLCPIGWHVPTDAEWTTLADYLGGVNIAGGKMKEIGYVHWKSPNAGATNESGFTGLPGAYRADEGPFGPIGEGGLWGSTASAWSLSYLDALLFHFYPGYRAGTSIRCLQDIVTTTEVNTITKTTAKSGGNIINDGGSPVTVRGVCWNTSSNPTADLITKTSDGTGLGTFTSAITGLSPGTTYFLRAYATNTLGTSYGHEISFKTYNSEAIQDVEGNFYNIVTIGSQIWLAENLRTTLFNDGISITNVTDNSAWIALSAPAYCWYNNDLSNKNKFGALYNGYVINTGKLCPTGWHVPSDGEWTDLTTYLGGEGVAGGKLKESGILYWKSPNTGATNEAGFSGLPGGLRVKSTGAFIANTEGGHWWSSSAYDVNRLWYRRLSFDSEEIRRLNDGYLSWGFSVRCIKNTAQSSVHFTPVWSGSGMDHMNLYALTAKLDNIDLQPGDEIGIFDGDVCVGMGTLTQVLTGSTYLSMVVSKDDPDTPGKDGYTPGNTISFKVWDSGSGKEVSNAQADYVSGSGIFSVGGTASFNLNAVSSITQDISLTAGWNIMSFAGEPDNMSLSSIVNSLKVAGTLVKIQDEKGSAIEQLPSPIGWVDNIGLMKVSEGYKIKVSANTTLSVTGKPVTLPYDIDLSTGWNIMGYPSMSSQAAMAAFQSMINAGTLLKVQDEKGSAIEQLPAPIGWVDNIHTLAPGEGYKIKVSSATSITINNSGKGEYENTEFVTLLKPSHFKPAYTGNGFDHMNIYLKEATIGGAGLQPGDEIGVFDGGVCVGSVVVEDPDSEYIMVTASFDDPTTKETDGFIAGHNFTLKLWDRQTGIESNTKDEQYEKGSGNLFERLGTSVLMADFDPMSNISFGYAYPNPSTEKTTFTFEIAEETDVRLEIFNMRGDLIKVLVDRQMPGGVHHIEWDNRSANGARASSGIYFYKLMLNNFTQTKQLVIK